MPPSNPKLLMKAMICFLIASNIFSSFGQANNPLINSGELIKQGVELHDQGKYKEAMALYFQVPRSDTNYDNSLYELSLSAYANNQFEESRKYAELGAKLFPERADDFNIQLANALDNLGKNDEALNLYEKTIQLFPRQYILYFNNGLALKNLKKPEEAKAAFQKALLINSVHSSSHFYLGKAWFEEGNLVPAMLAFQTYLLAAPSGRYAKTAVQYLVDISKVTDDVLKNSKNKNVVISPDFSLIQQIVLSKIALDKQYKLNTKLEDVIVRQMQVVMEKLAYNKNDKSFAMQFYVPFYTGVFKEEMFEPMVYQMFSGLGIADIDNWNKKHKTEIEKFNTYGSAYFTGIKSTGVLDAEERKNAKMKYVYSDGKLFGKGVYLDEEKQLATGEWEFYYLNTTLKTKGLFNGEGNRAGEWNLYHPDGSLQEKLNYKAGKQNGTSQGWFKNGNPWYTEYYNNELLEGLQTIYYFNGNVKSETNFKAGKKDGMLKEYYSTGAIRAVTPYRDDKKEGQATTYYKNGVVESVWNYKNDLAEGAGKDFSQNGKLSQEGNAVENKKDGLWTSYYDNGKLKEKTTYQKGDITGEYFQYFENGNVSQKGNYNKGMVDGKTEEYDEDSKLTSDYVYDNGRLKEVNFYDKNGKVISSTGTRRGAATITFYDPLGGKLSQGFYNKDGNRNGTFTYYYPSGKTSQVEEYKDGELNGMLTGYYANGNKKFENQYVKGVQDGYSKNYFSDTKMKYEGWVKEGQKQGDHIYYDPFGNVTARQSYLNDELNKYSEFYFPGKKPDYESKFMNGWLEQIIQYDSTGKVWMENNYKKGNGPMLFKHYSGKNMIEGNYRNYALDGSYKTFYFNGTPETIRYYKQGDEDSIYISYYFGGGINTEGKFKDGDKTGKWKYYYENGKLKEEDNYENGKLSGEDKFFNQDGSLDRVSTYKDDVLNGPYKIYADGNHLAVQLNYKDDLVKSYAFEDKTGKLSEPILMASGTGKVTAYFANGTKSAEIEVADGTTNGERKIYFTTGKIYAQGMRKEDFYEGTRKVYFPDGTLYTEQAYANGVLHGVSKTYYPSGKIQLEQNYYNGDLHGTTRYYNDQGKVKQTLTYYYNTLLTAQ